jgi:hypothetical protein
VFSIRIVCALTLVSGFTAYMPRILAGKDTSGGKHFRAIMSALLPRHAPKPPVTIRAPIVRNRAGPASSGGKPFRPITSASR